MELETFLSNLNKVKKTGKGYLALCPAHDDQKHSLSVTQEGEKILVKCFTGCTTESIVESLDLKLSDLFVNKRTSAPKIVKTYDYTDEDGKLIFQVCRLEPKSFRQRHKNGRGEWLWDMKGVRRVLYHLPDVVNANALYFVEGEKDADNLISQGVVATTSPGGANAWRDGYAQPLYGKRVVLIPDNDPAGHTYAAQVAASLRGHANVSCVLLPDKDVSVWLANGHTVDELPKMEQPVVELLWGVFEQLRSERRDWEKRIARLEQRLDYQPYTKPKSTYEGYTIENPTQHQ